jgi:imidazolonepropionase
MTLLLTDIGELTTNTDNLGTLTNAALVIDGTRIAWVGPTSAAPAADTAVSLGGRAALPGWVTEEFGARMAGAAYRAGGIATTVSATRSASDAHLSDVIARHVAEAVSQGTTYIETKTGYGLDVPNELRSAQLAGSHVDEVTFLGAHLVPSGWDADSYVDLVCGEMLDAVAPHVRWIDVFCETGAFDASQSRAVLAAGAARGLGLRVHGNQLDYGPGVRLAVEMAAASVDHCTYLTKSDVDDLSSSETVATLLPACDLSTRQPLPDAQALLNAGATVALASNCNPGSSYTTSMAFCVATAVLQMRMSVAEAVRAATWGGARALRRENEIGIIKPGARADVHVLDAPSITHLAYRPGVPLTHSVYRAGELVSS